MIASLKNWETTCKNIIKGNIYMFFSFKLFSCLQWIMFAWWGYNYIAWNIQMCTYSRSRMAFIGTNLLSFRLLIYFLYFYWVNHDHHIYTISKPLMINSIYVNVCEYGSWVQTVLHVTMTWIRLYAYCVANMNVFIYLEINVLPLSFKGWSTMINYIFYTNWYVQNHDE